MRGVDRRSFRYLLLRSPLIGKAIINWRYRTERALIRGRHSNKCQHRSILHFSINKAATQYTKRILKRCAEDIGMVHIQLNEYAFNSNFPFLDHLTADQLVAYQHIFAPRGYLYSVFGGAIEGVRELQEYHVLLMVRDPRDVLTSGYFSIAHSHEMPAGGNKLKSFMSRKTYAQSIGIDEFVLQDSRRLHQIYRRYIESLLYYPNVHVFKYENMVADFPKWLNTLLNCCELRISDGLYEELLKEAENSRPEEESVTQNRRQVVPGDHRRKLKRPTIDKLDRQFTSVLETFGYA